MACLQASSTTKEVQNRATLTLRVSKNFKFLAFFFEKDVAANSILRYTPIPAADGDDELTPLTRNREEKAEKVAII